MSTQTKLTLGYCKHAKYANVSRDGALESC